MRSCRVCDVTMWQGGGNCSGWYNTYSRLWDVIVTHAIVLASGCVCVVLWDYRQCLRVVLLYLEMVKDSHNNLELTQLTNRMIVRLYIWI